MFILLKLFQKIEEERILSISFYKASIILIANGDKETTATTTNYRPISLINIGAKVLRKVLASGIKRRWKGTCAMIKWGLSRGSKDGSVSANQPTWYTTLTNQKIKIISLDLENASDKIQHPFMIKLLNKVCIKKTF